MNIKDAQSILYPTALEEKKPIPQFEKGKFYVIEFEVKEFIGKGGSIYRFKGSEFAAKEYDSKWVWAEQLLIDAIPALGWEVRDMLEKRKEFAEGAAKYFEKFGTAGE